MKKPYGIAVNLWRQLMAQWKDILSRAGHKDDAAQEISKAIWYLERLRDSLVRTDTPTWNYAPRPDEQ